MARSSSQGRKKKANTGGKNKKAEKKGTQAKKDRNSTDGNQKKGKRGGKRGKQKKTEEPRKPMTQEELDRQMDEYMMKDPKTANKKLNDDMDSYWEKKKDKEADATEDDGETKKAAAGTEE